MASNPMQRKARNSFLLGMVVMLLISGAVIALLLLQLINKSSVENDKLDVYVLNQDISSGQVITKDMLVKKTFYKNLIPSNALGEEEKIKNYSLKDKEGNEIYTKSDKNGNTKLYIKKDKQEYEVIKETETENYYIEKNNEKEYLELNTVPLIAKVSMRANTIITPEFISRSDNFAQDDVRTQEYNVVVLPTDLKTGDYIDVRAMFPNGQDYIVVSKKEVEIPESSGASSDDTIWINLSEDETLHMSCAIIDVAQVKGAKLYATKYTDAGIQKAAIPTYIVNGSTSNLLQTDPNILEKALNEIINRYSRIGVDRREEINSNITNQGEEAKTNLETVIEESITNQKNSRKEYLESLSTPDSTTDSTTSE